MLRLALDSDTTSGVAFSYFYSSSSPVLTPPASLCVIFADLARTESLNVQAAACRSLSNKAICTTDGAAVPAVMPLTAGRRQRVKFVNYVNFNWPPRPTPAPSLYVPFYTIHM